MPSATVNIGKQAKNITYSEQLDAYDTVRIIAGTDDDGNQLVYEAGSGEGSILEFENPFGTQSMANIVYAAIQGYEYQPLYADGACLDPAAELGDGITANGVSSGICECFTTFNSLMLSDVAAPVEEEVIHEYEVQTPEERKFQRLQADTQSQFAIQANLIDAKVSKTDGSNQFGWSLTEDEWRVYSESGNILKASDDGLEVKGKITADEGYIGGSGGFTIKATKMYSGIENFGEDVQYGVYIGTNGIQLGNGFKVDASGSVTASNLGVVGGYIEIGSDTASHETVTGDYVLHNNPWIKDGSGDAVYIEFPTGTDPHGFDYYTYALRWDDSSSSSPIGSLNYYIDGQTLSFSTSWLNSLDKGVVYIYAYTEIFDMYEKVGYFYVRSSDLDPPIFRVDQGGNVYATSLTLNGGSININNEFMVDTEGNLMANTGTFKGAVYAGGIQYGLDEGYFDGQGLLQQSVLGGLDGALGLDTIDTSNVVAAINASLANGDNAWDEIVSGFSGGLNIDGTLVYRNRVVTWKQVMLAGGGYAYAMCQ